MNLCRRHGRRTAPSTAALTVPLTPEQRAAATPTRHDRRPSGGLPVATDGGLRGRRRRRGGTRLGGVPLLHGPGADVVTTPMVARVDGLSGARPATSSASFRRRGRPLCSTRDRRQALVVRLVLTPSSTASSGVGWGAGSASRSGGARSSSCTAARRRPRRPARPACPFVRFVGDVVVVELVADDASSGSSSGSPAVAIAIAAVSSWSVFRGTSRGSYIRSRGRPS